MYPRAAGLVGRGETGKPEAPAQPCAHLGSASCCQQDLSRGRSSGNSLRSCPRAGRGSWHSGKMGLPGRATGLHSGATLDNLLPPHGPHFPLLQRVRLHSAPRPLWVLIAYSRAPLWSLIVNIMGYCLDKYFSRKYFYHNPQ